MNVCLADFGEVVMTQADVAEIKRTVNGAQFAAVKPSKPVSRQHVQLARGSATVLFLNAESQVRCVPSACAPISELSRQEPIKKGAAVTLSLFIHLHRTSR